ncbi:MAG TPA: hypothetical protein VGH52_11265 [Gaiellaceae bacterium]|jgi:hypothetical protein
MTDVLAERFAALADQRDDSSWLDVRRRARVRRGRATAAVVAVAAVVCVAGAYAAASTWLFHHGPDSIDATTHVQFHGVDWKIYLSVTPDRAFCAALTRPGQKVKPGGCNLWVQPIPLFVQGGKSFKLVLSTPPFDGLRYVDGRGELWYGVAQANITHIAITDTSGRVRSTATAAPPHAGTSARRFWALPLPSSHAMFISGYDAKGQLVKRTNADGNSVKFYTRP